MFYMSVIKIIIRIIVLNISLKYKTTLLFLYCFFVTKLNINNKIQEKYILIRSTARTICKDILDGGQKMEENVQNLQNFQIFVSCYFVRRI